MDSLIGTWVGYYEYGLGYGFPFFGKRVVYQIDITIENEDFMGTAVEEKSPYSVDSSEAIKGFIEGDLISFVKTYPTKSTIRNDDVIEISKGEQLVNHTGYLDRVRKTMYGLWTIEQNYVDIEFPKEVQQCEGIWLLEKQ